MAADLDNSQLMLRVTGRQEVARDVILLEFQPIGGGVLPEWEPGAHLEVRLPSGLTRQYSLCGDPQDRHTYAVAVLREANGRGGSEEVHRELQTGTALSAGPPRNHFPLVEADSFVLIAGGIGITPIKAMVESLQRRGLDWRLVYGGRGLDSMAFAKELASLGAERVHLIPQDTDGLIDVGVIVGSAGDDTHVYCCGPSGLLDAVTKACAAAGISDRLHLERFTAPESGTGAQDTDVAFDIEMQASGVTLHVAADQSILEVVQAVRPDIDFSCQEGYCGSCETRVLAGRPDHRGSLMTPEEHDAEGTMLICVGRSRSPRLVLDL